MIVCVKRGGFFPPEGVSVCRAPTAPHRAPLSPFDSSAHFQQQVTAEAAPAPASWTSYLTSTAQMAASYLPATVTDVFSQARSFAQITLPFEGMYLTPVLPILLDATTIMRSDMLYFRLGKGCW